MNKIKVVRNDVIPAFAAWCEGSLVAEDGTVLLNVDACLEELMDEDGKPVQMNRARIVVESLMHEFGHAVEEALGLEHDEELIEDATAKFFK
jgi:hypothetical protein